ncbi:MAG: sigma-70 family RNA polymerase sigma factor, partial [Planctomycetota bacterium]|nr:sigma-70 family RNA polymerase sigma factor [Planctomycetota bacterium]
MSRMGSGSVARGLRVLFESGALGALDDGELLERFLEANADVSESAFRVLVERHGPMVLNICRGRLELHDAHDAFQATFLVLARKAGSVRKHGSLASWLHGAALRVVAKSRTQTSRRLGRERRAAESRPKFEKPSEHIDDRERDAVLHEELARLPLKYRTPLVLCYLEGLTHELAAERLDWPVGTVRGRLARGRDQLRARLARRGFDASALLPAARAFEASTRLVPAALADATVRSAAYAATYAMSGSISVLTQGVVQTMIMSKLKIAAMLTTVAAVGATGVGLITLRAGNEIDAGAEPIRGPVTWPQAGAIMKRTIPRPASAAGGMAGMMKGRRDSGLDEILQNSQDLDGYVSDTERDIDAMLEALGKERDGRTAAIQQSLATHLAAKK